jgi:opacity protein-like surface antigen
MRITFKAALSAVAIAFVASAAGAQSFSFGLRGSGSIPTGSFSETQQGAGNAALLEGAKSGFGFGLDVGLSLRSLGIYAGFDRVNFDCETTTCQSDGKYTLQGVTAGVKFSPMSSSRFHPYAKAGVTFNSLEGTYGSSSNGLTTDRAPGYEVAVGADINLMGLVSFTPQARYIGQELKAKVPGVSAPAATGQGVNYFTFDLGLSVHTPFGR